MLDGWIEKFAIAQNAYQMTIGRLENLIGIDHINCHILTIAISIKLRCDTRAPTVSAFSYFNMPISNTPPSAVDVDTT
ncbi:hypothetical protein WL46_15320 [Burkholderia ubonensis]|nr:hypothetical protein WL46_15320 [Burkholderia ubonensis]